MQNAIFERKIVYLKENLNSNLCFKNANILYTAETTFISSLNYIYSSKIYNFMTSKTTGKIIGMLRNILF